MSNDIERMIILSEPERIRMKWLWLFQDICLKGLRQTIKILRIVCVPAEIQTRHLLKYISEVLPHAPPCCILTFEVDDELVKCVDSNSWTVTWDYTDDIAQSSRNTVIHSPLMT
jgi:hypothetical protein